MCTRTAKRLTRRCLRFDNRANRALLYPCCTLVLFSSTFHLLLLRSCARSAKHSQQDSANTLSMVTDTNNKNLRFSNHNNELSFLVLPIYVVLLQTTLHLPPITLPDVRRVDASLLQQRASLRFLLRQNRRSQRLWDPPAHRDARESEERGRFRQRNVIHGGEGVGEGGIGDGERDRGVRDQAGCGLFQRRARDDARATRARAGRARCLHRRARRRCRARGQHVECDAKCGELLLRGERYLRGAIAASRLIRVGR